MDVSADPAPGAAWDQFVEAQPGATVGHAAAWARILAQAYGFSPTYLVARNDAGAIEGVLPLVRFKRPFGAAHLISLPFMDAAGVLATTPAAETALLDAALERARADGAADLELRNARPMQAVAPAQDLDRVNLIMDLAEDEEAQWSALRAKVRNQTRKATKSGLALLEVPDPSDLADPRLLDGFYGPFEVNMRDLGSPVHARRFYEVAQAEFGDRLRFFVTHDDGRPVGGLVAIHYGDRVTVPWASTLRSERARCPNNQIYWAALCWAIERGARRFDFGRSPQGSGTHRFKVGWGAQEEPLPWLRLAPDGRPCPISVGERSRAVATLSEWWTRLPVPLATRIGARLRPYFSN